MVIQIGEVGITLDTGTNAPGAILQKYDSGEWRDFLVDGKHVTDLDLNELPPGQYRLIESPVSGA